MSHAANPQAVARRLRAQVRRRLATAVVVGMLTIGAPPPRPFDTSPPPAIVRVIDVRPGALAWRELFPQRRPPN